jgi:hypothetical protein
MAKESAEQVIFQRRLVAMFRRPEIKIARKQMIEARKLFLAAYEREVMEFWKENGNAASTGWGTPPGAPFANERDVKSCARQIALRMWHYLSENPQFKQP